MIEYLVVLWLLKMRADHEKAPQRVEEYPLDRSLEIGAGLDFQPPEESRPDLRIVR